MGEDSSGSRPLYRDIPMTSKELRGWADSNNKTQLVADLKTRKQWKGKSEPIQRPKEKVKHIYGV